MTSTRAILGLALLTALAYGGIWSAGFVYDDANWLPVPATAYDLVLRVPGRAPFLVADILGGGLPWAYHGLILALHLLNGVLLYRLARRWLSEAGSLLALGLFWLHPLQVEAVAYVSGGFEVLLTSYVLIAATCLVRGTRAAVLWSLVAFGLALSLKLSALALLVVAPVAGLILPRKYIGLLALALIGAVAVYGWPALRIWVLDHPAPYASLGDHLNAIALATWRYLALVVWPIGFSVEHNWQRAGPVLGAVAVAGAALIGYFLWVGRQVWAAPWYGWLWMTALLLPRAFAVYDGSPLTEHHTMLPFLAVWLTIGSALDAFRGEPAEEGRLYARF